MGLTLSLTHQILILKRNWNDFLSQLTSEKWSCLCHRKKQFLELVYDHQGIFSLCNEDLGLCDCLKHTIPTTMSKPIYLPHHTILVQLQTEVRKCLDTWLKQGIICPSHSPYASQVVIVHKKSGEICLCIDFRALNTITIHDSFPLPCIEEALQAVKSAMWFTSFDLAQGYLQLAMDEADIHKTVFCAGSSGLYELHAFWSV